MQEFNQDFGKGRQEETWDVQSWGNDSIRQIVT